MQQMKKNDYSSRALIETLHAVQESFGFIDDEALKYVSDHLHVLIVRLTVLHILQLLLLKTGRGTCAAIMYWYSLLRKRE
jgi:bidirectional [NiFe] hydrogenase diaphorase subunit